MPAVTFTVVARTAADPASATPAIREVLRTTDPDLPVYDVRTMEDRIARSVAQSRGTMLLLLATAALAAALAAVAIYGSIWYSVSQRMPEIGIRMALGAMARPLLASFLFETGAADGLTIASVVGFLAALTLAAAAVPAWRATRVDPIVALREE
jgi:ABC-type antimicrobial peptide transport system permease subunit